MPRAHRPEQPGGFFHVVGRAIRDEVLFRDDRDRCLFLLGLRDVIGRTGWSCLTYCLMSTHYHFLVRTPEPNLADGMRRLNGRYAQSFNRHHRERGHAFGARYWAEPVRRDEHLLETLRYVALNPVRAGAVVLPEQWRWGAHRFLADRMPPRGWLDVDEALSWFGGPNAQGRARYTRYVELAPTTTRTSAR
jgi:REP element-mobilizing transposase RayT